MNKIRTQQNSIAACGFSSRRSISPGNLDNSPYNSAEDLRTLLPKLVISDAVEATKVLIAKTRAEVGSLDALLRSLSGVPSEAK